MGSGGVKGHLWGLADAQKMSLAKSRCESENLQGPTACLEMDDSDRMHGAQLRLIIL
jgi:hypothetical protein